MAIPFLSGLEIATGTHNEITFTGTGGAKILAPVEMYLDASNDIYLMSHSSVNLTLGNDTATFSGNVSINTTSAPVGNLQVVGNTGSAGRLYISDVDEGTNTGKGLLAMKSGVHAYYYNRDSGSLYLGAHDDPNKLIITNTAATFSGSVVAGDV